MRERRQTASKTRLVSVSIDDLIFVGSLEGAATTSCPQTIRATRCHPFINVTAYSFGIWKGAAAVIVMQDVKLRG
jgi:hypothetical protein